MTEAPIAIAFLDANVFYPHRLSLAFSDSLLGYGPAGLFGSGTVAALVRYNLLFLFAWALPFVGTYLLARELAVLRERVAPAVELNVAPHPLDIGLLGAQAVMAIANPLPQLIEQASPPQRGPNSRFHGEMIGRLCRQDMNENLPVLCSLFGRQ